MDTYFERFANFLLEHRFKIILLVLILTVLPSFGLFCLKEETSLQGWLLADDELSHREKEFSDLFGNSEYVIIVVDSKKIFSYKILQLIRHLGNEIELNIPYVKNVISLCTVKITQPDESGFSITKLVSEPIPSDEISLLKIKKNAIGKKYLRERLFSSNSHQTALIVELKRYPASLSSTLCQYKVAKAIDKLLAKKPFCNFNITVSGLPISNYERDKWIKHESIRLFGLALIIMIIFISLMTGTWVAIIVPIISIAISFIWAFGIMGLLGIKVDPFVKIIPILLGLVLSIGYTIHIITFFEHFKLKEASIKTATAKALGHTGWPLFLTAFTTLLGFLSFEVISIKPVQWLGTSSSLMIGFSFLSVILFTPILLSLTSFSKKRFKGVKNFISEKFLLDICHFVLKNGRGIIILFILLLTISFIGMTRLEVNTDTFKTTGLRVPFVRKLYYVAHTIGSLYSYDATITFPKANIAKNPKILHSLDKLAAELSQNPMVKRTFSLTSLVKELNQTIHDGNTAFYAIPDTEQSVAQLLLLYEIMGGARTEKWVNFDFSTLRLQVEFKNYSTKGAEQQLLFFKKRAKELFPNAKLGLTGVPILYGKMVNYLVSGMINSIIIALIFITLVMIAIFSSVKLGLIGMIPNVTPVIVTVGFMGLFGTPLHMLTIVIAPMIVGIAVDDTIHYIHHIKTEYAKSGDYTKASCETFRNVGKAIAMTSIIICLGFSVFLFSKANQFVHLGFYTILATSIALLADYTLTPLLISWFKPFSQIAKVKPHKQN